MNCGTRIILLLASLVACSSSPTDTLENIEQSYLFEVEYQNYAWGFVWRGLVIDRDGDIVAYDHSHEAWVDDGAESYTEVQLQGKYEHGTRYVGRIDEATVVTQFANIAGVAEQLSAPQYPCADAGSLTYTAFRYDSATGRYRPLLLRQEGDMVKANTSDAGEDLAAWLQSLVSALEDAGVTPFTEGMCTP